MFVRDRKRVCFVTQRSFKHAIKTNWRKREMDFVLIEKKQILSHLESCEDCLKYWLLNLYIRILFRFQWKVFSQFILQTNSDCIILRFYYIITVIQRIFLALNFEFYRMTKDGTCITELYTLDFLFCFRCTENGTWYVNPHAKRSWTNYTTCVDVEDLDVSITQHSIDIVCKTNDNTRQMWEVIECKSCIMN